MLSEKLRIRSKKQTSARARKKIDWSLIGFLAVFILPGLITYLVLYIWPFIYAFFISLFKWKGYSMNMTFVGLDNFKRLLSDEVVLIGLKNNLFFLVWSTVVIFVLSMFFAVSVTRLRVKFPNFFRITFFLPNTFSIIVVGTLWMFIYNPSIGLFNAILETLGLEGLIQDWLGDKNVVMKSLVAPQAWMYIGFYMVQFIAAISNIPEDIYEAATIDGAGQIRQFFNITIPLIQGTLRTALVFFVVNAFSRTFALVNLVTEGGPNHASELLTTYLYRQAFQFSDFGYATTIGLVLFVVVATISFTLYKISERDAIEY